MRSNQVRLIQVRLTLIRSSSANAATWMKLRLASRYRRPYGTSPMRSDAPAPFIVAEKIGGQVIGAFDDGKLVAFALSVPGARGGHSYLHSQMLAVSAEYRNAGLGRRIKFFQREDALACGFELIEWTFDPLEIKNAYLNIERLGAIARRYSVNQYGFTSSPLQGGLPSDRLVAEWWLKSKRVEYLLLSEFEESRVRQEPRGDSRPRLSGRVKLILILTGRRPPGDWTTEGGCPHWFDIRAESNFGAGRNLWMEGFAGYSASGPGSSGAKSP